MLGIKKIFIKNTFYVTVSQFLSLLVSALLILILPRFISIEEYGYWQLFILYTGYVGLFHFGYADGIYIKFGGKDIKTIDNKSISKQFNIFVIFQILLSIIILIVAARQNIVYKKYIFTAISIYLIIDNCYKLLSFLLLATDNSDTYSKSVFIDKILLCLYLLSFLFVKSGTYLSVITAFIAARFMSLIYVLWYLKGFFTKNIGVSTIKNTVKGIADTCKVGIVLTASNLLSILIMTSGRLFIDYFWDIKYFAKISLSISLSFFVMAFISQISLVLFPLIRKINTETQRLVLKDGSLTLGFISMISFGIYFILLEFIKYWLPDYIESSSFLIYLFPIVLYEIKVQVLYVTYCKSLNKIKALLVINILVFIISVVLYFIASNIHSIELVLITMLFVLVLRSFMLHFYLYKYYQIKTDRYFFIEMVFVLSFILIHYFYGNLWLFIFYILSCFALYFLYINEIKRVVNYIKSI